MNHEFQAASEQQNSDPHSGCPDPQGANLCQGIQKDIQFMNVYLYVHVYCDFFSMNTLSLIKYKFKSTAVSIANVCHYVVKQLTLTYTMNCGQSLIIILDVVQGLFHSPPFSCPSLHPALHPGRLLETSSTQLLVLCLLMGSVNGAK